MITYIIKHHVPGQIRLDVPALRKIAGHRLRKISNAMTRLPVFMGIRDLTVNPANGSVGIEYDAEVIDIIDYLEDMSVIVETLDCLEEHR
jgi:uncharacterized protein (UPF0371 family)